MDENDLKTRLTCGQVVGRGSVLSVMVTTKMTTVDFRQGNLANANLVRTTWSCGQNARLKIVRTEQSTFHLINDLLQVFLQRLVVCDQQSRVVFSLPDERFRLIDAALIKYRVDAVICNGEKKSTLSRH